LLQAVTEIKKHAIYVCLVKSCNSYTTENLYSKNATQMFLTGIEAETVSVQLKCTV